MWDLAAASRVNHFITNSQNVARRIKRYYQRDALVIYPPVDTHLFQITEKLGDYFLIGGRMTSYKRFDMVVQTFNKLLIPLKVFGVGPWHKAVRRQAGKNIEFIGAVSEKDKRELFSRARAFIYPQIENLT